MRKGRPAKKILPITVVYRKNPKGKAYMRVFENMDLDQFLTSRRFNNIFPETYTIEELGLGKGLIKEYKEKYNIKKIQ